MDKVDKNLRIKNEIQAMSRVKTIKKVKLKKKIPESLKKDLLKYYGLKVVNN